MEAKRWYVYVVANRANGKVYVGKTATPEKRWYEHVRSARRRSSACRLLARAILKHGAEAFCFEVKSGHWVEADALDEERRRIAEMRSDDPAVGYNLTEGGEGAAMSEESKRLIAASLRGHSISPETRAKISESVKKAYAEGRLSREHLSELAKQQHAAGEFALTDGQKAARSELTTKRNRERVWTPEAREKARRTQTVKKQSPEAKAKISAALAGRPKPPRTEEHRAATIANLAFGRTRACSEEANEKRRQKMKGRKMSAEFRQKIKASWDRRRRSNAE